MTAIPLQKLGHQVTILERSPVPLLHDQGAGIVAGGDTLAWVQKHGHSRNTADDISVLSQWRYYLDIKGNVIDRENSHQRMTSWGVLYNLDRENFDGITRDSARDVAQAQQVKGTSDTRGSHLRRDLLGESTAQRTYAGYVAFRGTVSESELSTDAGEVFVEKFSFFHGRNPNTQILAYTIPNAEGSLAKGERFVNWVWYHNVAFDSDEATSTDSPSQQEAIADLKPPQTKSEVVGLLNGKCLIMGDAYSGFRPHTAASTSQAAFQSLRLEEVFKGDLSCQDYEGLVFDYATRMQAHGVRLGDRSQFGSHPLAGS